MHTLQMESISAFESSNTFMTPMWPFCAAWYSGVHCPYKTHTTLTLQHFHHNIINTHSYTPSYPLRTCT